MVEDVGAGTEHIAISFLTPEDMGFDMDRFNPPNVGTLVAANGLAARAGAPPEAPKVPAVMCHFIREIPEGAEFRTRFWMGYHILDKKPYYCLPKIAKIPPMVGKGLAIHNVFEYSNLRSFLPQIYREEHDKAA